MFGKINLAYLALQVRDPARWRRFAVDMLGLPAPTINDDGTLALRLDDRVHRFILRQGAADDIDALGWEVAEQKDFDGTVARAQSAGAHPAMGDTALCKARHVERLVHFTGPDGVRNELVMGLGQAGTAFASKLMPGGFRTGAMGLGHAVLSSTDMQQAASFYRDVLGMRLSQEFHAGIGPIKIGGVFLHCNPRHHSLALFQIPTKGRMHHVMIEANDMRDVGGAWERAQNIEGADYLDAGPAPRARRHGLLLRHDAVGLRFRDRRRRPIDRSGRFRADHHPCHQRLGPPPDLARQMEPDLGGYRRQVQERQQKGGCLSAFVNRNPNMVFMSQGSTWCCLQPPALSRLITMSVQSRERRPRERPLL